MFLSSSDKILHEYSAHTPVPENSAHTSVPEDPLVPAQSNSGGAHWRPWEAKTESADCPDRQEGGGALSPYEVEAANILLLFSKK